jgi:DNA-directed RNA polymerase III subunit RPC6
MSNSNDKVDPINAEQRILELCAQNPEGINDTILQHGMPQVSAQQRVAALNRLLSQQKLDLLKSAQLGIVYRLKDKDKLTDHQQSSKNTSGADSSAGADMDEKLVYTVIKESGNKGIWIRDIATKTNVKSAALNKTLKSLEKKKLIKSLTSVNANKKKVYMLFDIEPDRSITGGAWYSGKEFESEFVEILNEQCYHYLCERKEELEKQAKYQNDPILMRSASFVSSKDIRDYIRDLRISKVDLNLDDIETILNTLVYDGKVEKSIVIKSALSQKSQEEEGSGGHMSLFRAIESVLDNKLGSGLVRMPCGICPQIENCHPDGIINPQMCVYMKDWLEF